MKTIYVDNNATTAVAPEVRDAVLPFLEENYFNPSSMYDAAGLAHDALVQARQTIARHLGAENPKEVLLTSCATESNNTAILGACRANPSRRHIITSAVEHPAVLEVCRDLERGGYRVSYIPVDRQGNLDLGELVRALDRDTLLVTIMHANNETGVIFPIERISRIVKETDPTILFHTDATQSVTKLTIDMERNFRFVDLMSFSGHKFHAPKGVGALYMRRGTPCRPLLIGGHQEGGRRGGTENVAFGVAMAKAMEVAAAHHEADYAHLESLRNRLEQGIIARVPHIEINGRGAPRMPNTLNIACHYVEGESILYQLSEAGICASSGSACTSGSLEPSHVLLAMNVPFTAVHGSIRFSLSRYNTVEEVDRIIDVFPRIIANLRNLSPYWDQAKNAPRENADKLIVEQKDVAARKA